MFAWLKDWFAYRKAEWDLSELHAMYVGVPSFPDKEEVRAFMASGLSARDWYRMPRRQSPDTGNDIRFRTLSETERAKQLARSVKTI